MPTRRTFLRYTITAGAAPFCRPAFADEKDPTPAFRLSRHVATKYYDGQRCWCHPRAGILPKAGKDGAPRVVMTMNSLDVSGSDVFKGMFGLQTDDLGENWTKPELLKTMAPRYEVINKQKRPVAVSDFWPGWHAASKSLLGTGHTVVYTPDWKVRKPRPRHTSYSVYDPRASQWAAWKKLDMPDRPRFRNAGAGCTQRFDEKDGTILLPFYFHPPGKNSHVSVMRCAFDGETLRFKQHGTVLHIGDKTRGLHEPSLAKFGDEYFLTIRNDKRGFVTRGKDGLTFEPIREWKFDDGKPLGNYNTQQHWVAHSDGLFLVYTRKGANNDHVFRHRAPLFMAQVDPKRLRVIRDTETILVPERGARLGNFGVTHVSEHETWVTVAEWMQTWGPNHRMKVNNKYGSDGSVHVARIRWAKPNRSFRA